MRHVYPGGEIPHLWAHRNDPGNEEDLGDIRNSQNNLFTEGNEIYSYGHHFCLARQVKVGEEWVVLLNADKYSVTTAKQQGWVRSAVCHMKTFEVFRPERDDYSRMFRDYQEKIGEQFEKAKRAKRWIWIELDRLDKLIAEARVFAKVFGIRELVRIPKGLEQLRLEAPEKAEKWTEIGNRISQTQRENRQERWNHRISLNKGGTLLDFRLGIRRSIAGGDGTAYLRIAGEEIQTSMGVSFPKDHAKRAIRLIRRVVERGEDWHSNGETIRLGHYRVDRVEKNGTVHAGCHKVEFSEVQWIEWELSKEKALVRI